MIILIIIAISLSMDAFSLSLVYGTLNLSYKKILQLAIIVGIYHFFMPILGMTVGNFIQTWLKIDTDIMVCIVLLIIGIQMIIESFKKHQHIKKMSFIELLLFGLAVSIDSFSVGIGLKSINSNYILSALIFSIISFIFTYTGLYLGKKINNLIGKVSTFIGGITIIIVGICFLL
ncbi:MAG: manganese efflux pump [Bacilli bacterium]